MQLAAVNLHLTNRCNLRCRHCLYDSGVTPVSEARLPEIEDWLRQFAISIAPSGTLNLFGGEPLMHPDIFAVIECAAVLGFNIGITTNATLSRLFTQLLETPVRRVSIDLHGECASTHDYVRNQSGNLAHSQQSISQAVAADKVVSVNCALARFNQDGVEGVLATCDQLGVSNLSFYLLSSAGRGRDLAHEVLDAGEWLAIRDRIEAWCASHRPSFGIIWERCYDRANLCGGVTTSMCRSASSDTLDVRSDGAVFPCGLLMSTAAPFPWGGPTLGSLRTRSLGDILAVRSDRLFGKGEGCPALAFQGERVIDDDWYTAGRLDPRPRTPGMTLLCPYEWVPLWGGRDSLRSTHAHVAQVL